MKTGAWEDLASGSVRGDGGSGGGRERPHGQRWTAAAAAHREDLVSGGGGWGRRRLRATDGDLRPAAVDGEAPAVGKTSPLVQCAPAAEGDDDARSESRVERVMTDEA
uniref:DUF834 domain-containing protein n=1 Tax=Oryza rufipogon TaxID=4529 RepID=A0A0E0P681_ORYRU